MMLGAWLEVVMSSCGVFVMGRLGSGCALQLMLVETIPQCERVGEMVV